MRTELAPVSQGGRELGPCSRWVMNLFPDPSPAPPEGKWVLAPQDLLQDGGEAGRGQRKSFAARHPCQLAASCGTWKDTDVTTS